MARYGSIELMTEGRIEAKYGPIGWKGLNAFFINDFVSKT